MPVDLHFLRPYWFFALLALIPLLVMLWRRPGGASLWSRVVDAHLLPHLLAGGTTGGSRLPVVAMALGWLVVVTALAGPVWERLPQPVFSLTERHVLVLDLSPSMNATDVAPTRLARARFELLDLLKAASEGEAGLIAAGPEPFLVSPLSGDAKTIAAQVPLLDSALIPVPGPKRLDLALQMAGSLLDRPGGAPGDVILISDGLGEGAARAAALDAARRLAGGGHRVSVLGVGTLQGAPEPGPDGGFASGADGAIRITKLDVDGLSDLAAAGGGRYVTLDPADADTQALLTIGGLQAAGAEVADSGLVADQWREEGPLLLLALIPFAALAFRRGWILPGLLLCMLLPPQEGYALGWDDLWARPDQQGASAFVEGDHGLAQERFEDPAWRAAAGYHAGDYAGALDALEGLEGAEAAYNRGNALARLGRLEDAVAAYEETLDAVADHQDAQANLALVKRLLEQQQQQSQPGESGEQEQTDSGDGSDQSGESGDSSGAKGSEQSGEGGEEGSEDQQAAAGEQQQGASGGSDQGADESEGQQPDQKSQGDAAAGSERQEQRAGRAGDDSGEADSGATGQAGAEPNAEDLAGQTGQQPERQPGQAPGPEASDLGEQADEAPGEQGGASTAELAEDQEQDAEGTAAASVAGLSPGERERNQAIESQLRRVPDDPAGLLRQRFILQHLRRTGRLP